MYVLAVGGGGGGGLGKQPSDGTTTAGGGGAGGVVMTSVTLKGGLNNFTINVGSGGAGAVNTGANTVPGNQGNNTTISFKSNNVYDISAGGGQGGQTGVVYNNLGSAGGGSTSSSVPNSGRYYTIFANGSLATGGGGGARTPGGLLSGTGFATAGGVGIKCNLNGIKDFNPSGNKPYGLYYWGGGGAGSPGGYCSGGLGGGGGGAINYGVAPYSSNGLGDTNGINPASNSVLTANGYYFNGGYGGKNTGGGGGAGDISSNYYGSGGAGGSGIVVIAFSYFFTPANLLITDKLAINLDSSVFDISCNWIDQTAKGYSYTQYNAYSGSNVVYGSTSPTTPIDISKNYTNNYPVVQLNGSSNVTRYLWMNAVNGYIGSSDLFAKDCSGSYTYEIWVYPTAIKNATLIYEVGSSGWSDDQMALTSSNFVTSYYYNAGNYVTSNITYNTNNWYQIMNVYIGGTTYLTQYINGVNSKILTSTTITTKQNPNNGSLIIGSNAGNAPSYMSGLGTFQGYIGSFRAYNIALSTSQILQNYNYYRPTIFSFNPNSITGLSLWLDASDLSNNAFGSAPIYNYGNIGQFVNKATGTIYKGSGNITLNSIGLNNRPTLQFTGTQDFSGNIIITGQYVAIYIVGTNNYLNSPTTLYPRIIALTGAKVEQDYSSPLYCIVGTGLTNIYSSKNSISSNCTNISNSNPFLFCNWFDNTNVNTVCYTKSNSNVSYNTTANGGIFDISYVTIGSGHPSFGNSNFVGNISEILVYSSSTVCSTATSSANNRAIIEGYLSWKWGLQGNLPTNHAYYNYPP